MRVQTNWKDYRLICQLKLEQHQINFHPSQANLDNVHSEPKKNGAKQTFLGFSTGLITQTNWSSPTI